MSTLDMIAAALKELLTALQLRELRAIFWDIDIAQKAHDCLYNWIVDIAPDPGSIIDLLNNLKKFEGFSSMHGFQNLVAITCLEGIARRSPEVLEGSWEELILIIDYTGYYGMYENKGIVSLACIKEWIPDYCSPKLCPNPCLRLELFRFMSDLRIVGDVVSREALIFTLCVLHDTFSSFEIKEIIKCSAIDLKNVMKSNSLNIGNILESDYPKLNKERIIDAVVKITNIFAVLEEQNTRRHAIHSIVFCCLDFCGLITDLYYDHDLNSFADIVSNSSLLQKYVADTLRLITSAFSKLEGYHIYEVTRKKNKVLSCMVAAEARLLPLRLNRLPLHLHLYDRELNGITRPIAYQLLFFTIIKNSYYIEEVNDDTLESDNSPYTYIREQI